MREQPNDGKKPIQITVQDILDEDVCDLWKKYYAGKDGSTKVCFCEIIDLVPLEPTVYAFSYDVLKVPHGELIKEMARVSYPQAEEKEDAYDMYISAYQTDKLSCKNNAERKATELKWKQIIIDMFREDI